MEKLKIYLKRLGKYMLTGVVISFIVMILSIIYSLIKVGKPFYYIFDWTVITAAGITAIAALSTAFGVGNISKLTTNSRDINDESLNNDPKESSRTEKYRNIMMQREQNASTAFKLAIVGITIFIVSFIVELIIRSF